MGGIFQCSISRPNVRASACRCSDLEKRRGSRSRAAVACAASTGAFDSLSMHQQEQCNTFVDFMLEENRKYNLTAVRDRQEAFHRHVLDSLALLEVIEANVSEHGASRLSVIDVGSGPGLPGCILAIARPSWTVRCS